MDRARVALVAKRLLSIRVQSCYFNLTFYSSRRGGTSPQGLTFRARGAQLKTLERLNLMFQLVCPSEEHLPGYVAALKRGWSPNNERGLAASEEELNQI